MNCAVSALNLSLRALALTSAALAVAAANAQEMAPGVVLGMSATDLVHALPQLEHVRRPPRLGGGMVGAWRADGVQMLGLTGQQTYYIADRQLRRIEFVGTTPDRLDNGAAFERLVSWGRTTYGQEVASADPGSRIAEWNTGDGSVYVPWDDLRGEIRLVYQLRVERDAGQL